MQFAHLEVELKLRSKSQNSLTISFFFSHPLQGVCYPAVHGIWRFWAPPLERSRLATIAFCGTYAGIVLGLPISAILTEHFSWEAMFYFYGEFWISINHFVKNSILYKESCKEIKLNYKFSRGQSSSIKITQLKFRGQK